MSDGFSDKVSRHVAAQPKKDELRMLSEAEGRARLLEATADVVEYLQGTNLPSVPLGKRGLFRTRESGWLLGHIGNTTWPSEPTFHAVTDCVISSSGVFAFKVPTRRRNGVPFEADSPDGGFSVLARRVGRYDPSYIAHDGDLGVFGEGPVYRSKNSQGWDRIPEWELLSDYFAKLIATSLKHGD